MDANELSSRIGIKSDIFSKEFYNHPIDVMAVEREQVKNIFFKLLFAF